MNRNLMNARFQGGKQQKGFTLLETLLVIGILVVALAAVAAVAISTGASQAAANEARVMDTAGNQIRNIYSSTFDYANLTTDVAEGFDLFPESMGSTPTINTWGGTVTVNTPPANPKTADPVANRQFEINWPNVAEESCPSLATAQTSAIGVDVDGVEVYSRGVPALDPVQPSLVSQNCTEGSTVTFVYGKL